MYNLGFAMGVLAIIGALLIYKYRADIWAWMKVKAAALWAWLKSKFKGEK